MSVTGQQKPRPAPSPTLMPLPPWKPRYGEYTWPSTHAMYSAVVDQPAAPSAAVCEKSPPKATWDTTSRPSMMAR